MNTWINGSLATCRFELRRSFTTQRNAVTAVLILFPPLMIYLVLGAARVAASNGSALGIVRALPFAIIFLVSLVSLLSLLLWATPNVHSELEGKSWSFIASRPSGRISLYLGKFLAAFLVSYFVAVTAMSLCILVADRIVAIPDAKRLWVSQLLIYLLACFAYGAIFSMLGTLFYKRAMVVAAVYLVASEVFIASVPAVIGKLTLRYHLQELGIYSIGYFLPFAGGEQEYRLVYGDAWPVAFHILIPILLGSTALAIGAWVIVSRQYISADES